MPKLKKTPVREKQELLCRLIKSQMPLYGIDTLEKLSERLGFETRDPLYARMCGRTAFRQPELIHLCELLHFTDEMKAKVI